MRVNANGLRRWGWAEDGRVEGLRVERRKTINLMRQVWVLEPERQPALLDKAGYLLRRGKPLLRGLKADVVGQTCDGADRVDGWRLGLR